MPVSPLARRLAQLSSCALLTALCACAGPRQQTPTGHDPEPLPAAPLPGGELPGLDQLDKLPPSPAVWAKRTSAVINGADDVAQSGGRNREEDNALIIIPGSEDELAYAVYTQAEITLDKPVNIEFTVSPALIIPGSEDELAMEFWVALSNYTRNQWEWLGPFNNGSTSRLPRGASMVRKGASAVFSLPLNSEELRERYVSRPDINSECQMHYAVLVRATDDPDQPFGVKLETSNTNVSPEYFTNKPHYVPVFDPVVDEGGGLPARWPRSGSQLTKRASSVSIDMGWEHINSLGTDDDRNTCFCYQVRRQAEGSPTAEVIGLRFLGDPEGTAFRDPPDDSLPDGGYNLPPEFPVPGKPQPGTRYTYMIKAFNEDGFNNSFSGPTSTPSSRMQAVTLNIDPPQELRADYLPGQGILLSWSEVEGAVGYQVNRQYLGDPGAEVFGVHPDNSLLDQNIEDDRIAYYYVAAQGRHRQSAFSFPEARGYKPNDDEGNGVVTVAIGDTSIRFRKVPSGYLNLGSPPGEFDRDDTKEEIFQETPTFSPYYISETEITNGNWQDFMEAPVPGYTRSSDIWSDGGEAWRDAGAGAPITGPPYWNQAGLNNSGPDAFDNYPVLDVSWYEAIAFANWVEEQYDLQTSPPYPNAAITLPSEAEWEYAAEGQTVFTQQMWLYPWGDLGPNDGGILNDGDDGADMARCNSSSALDPFTGSAPVDSFPLGMSWCGAYNMAGNVAEWTMDEYNVINQPGYPFPWVSTGVNGTLPIIVRGGNFQNQGGFLRTSHREIRDIDSRGGSVPPAGGDGVGVRLVLVPVT